MFDLDKDSDDDLLSEGSGQQDDESLLFALDAESVGIDLDGDRIADAIAS